MEMLFKVKRSMDNKSKEYIVMLIRVGLIDMLKREIKMVIQKEDNEVEGIMIAISNVVYSLIIDNQEAGRLIIEQTDFVEYIITLLNSISKTKVKYWYLLPIKNLFQYLPAFQSKKLVNKGVIQFMVKLLDFQDVKIINSSVSILKQIIKTGIVGLNEGEQHPFLEHLTNDGTITQLIINFKDSEKQNIHYDLLLMLSYLYKAHHLPQELKFDIINELKQSNNCDILTLIAEFSENHDDILAGNYELQLFENGQYNVKYLTLAHPLLQYGSYQSKRKVALAIKCNVGMFNEENQFVEKMKYEIRFKVGINVGSEEQLGIKAQKIFDMINETVQESNIELIKHFMVLIISEDENIKQYSTQTILKILKLQIEKLQERQQHPFYSQLREEGIIEQLFKLFQNENDHNIHNKVALIIAILFKSHPLQTDLNEIIIRNLILENNFHEIGFLIECPENQNTIFAIIARDLLKSIEGIDEEKQRTKKLQENEFEFLDKLLQNRKDAEIRNNAANSGIIEALHNIFTTRNLDEILYFHFLAFFQFTWPYSAEMSRILVDKKSFDFLLRLLDHKNTKFVNESINAMVNIMYGGTIGLDENQVHPYYNGLISVGGIEKIYSLFKRNLKTSKDTASICLGIVFKAQKIEDKTMRKKIITHLKSISDRNDEEVEHALRCLSQNSDNRVEIEKNGFNLSDKKVVQ